MTQQIRIKLYSSRITNREIRIKRLKVEQLIEQKCAEFQRSYDHLPDAVVRGVVTEHQKLIGPRVSYYVYVSQSTADELVARDPTLALEFVYD